MVFELQNKLMKKLLLKKNNLFIFKFFKKNLIKKSIATRFST